MTQTAHRIPGQRADACRPGAIYLHMTRRVDRRGMPVDGTEKGYIGRSRDVARRTGQHAGLLPQRDGTIAESPWFDLKVGETQILEQGMWTDVELDERERYWIATLQPRYCDRDNPRPDKIRKFEARRHRDARDAARGLVPRQWEPLRVDPVKPAKSAKWRRRRNVALAYAGLWLALTVGLWWLSAAAGFDMPGRTYPIAAAGAVALVPLWRRCKRRERRFVAAVVAVVCLVVWVAVGAV